MNEFSHYERWVNAIDKFDKSDYQDWFRFAMLWFSFNSYYSERYMHIGREKDKIIEFSKDNEHLYEDLKKNSKEFKSVLDEFVKTKEGGRKEVKDRIPGKETVEFNQKKLLSSILTKAHVKIFLKYYIKYVAIFFTVINYHFMKKIRN